MSYASQCDAYWSRVPDSAQDSAATRASMAMQIATFCGAGPVLELGCGTGALVRDLARRGCDVVGLDASLRALTIAERSLPGKFVVADMRRLPFADESFEAVIAVQSLEWLLEDDDITETIAEIFRVARRLACLWIAPAMPHIDAPRRPRSWWEQRLYAQGFVRRVSAVATLPTGPGVTDPGPFAIVVERLSRATERTLEPRTTTGGEVEPARTLLEERDVTIRLL